MTKPNLTYVAIVLDESGSMYDVRQETIDSINGFIEEQKKVEGECRVTLQKFNTYVGCPVFTDADVRETPKLTDATYCPGGWTALYDAIGTTIQSLGVRLANMSEEERPSQVIVVIQTDGQENMSKMYDMEKVKGMIAHQKAIYNWDFVFLGVGLDAFAVGQQFGLSTDKILAYDTRHMKGTYGAVGNYVSSSRLSRNAAATGFTQNDRDASVGNK